MLKLIVTLCLIAPNLVHAQARGPGGPGGPAGGMNSACRTEIEALGCGKPGPDNANFRTCFEQKKSTLSANCQNMGGPRGGGPGGNRGPGGPASTTAAVVPPKPDRSTVSARGEVKTPLASTEAEPTESLVDCASVVDGERDGSQHRSGSMGEASSTGRGATPQ